jgi:histidyl-tRNA synthetase
MEIQSPPGVFDIMPFVSDEPWRQTHLWQYVEGVIKKLAFDYGFFEFRTPIFERAELFLRGIGEETDIVSKEMYVFPDRGGRELALRPEGTAPVMRALVEHGIKSPIQALRYFYIGPMFRYERPQAGRFRQHHQFGVELLGVSAPEADAEVISLLYQLYERLGLTNLKVHMNSLGDGECRTRFREALLEYLRGHLSTMSEDSQRRFDKNPLRILDSKDPNDKKVLEGAPSILSYLNSSDAAHFARIQELLTLIKVPFEISPLLVRGLDYYQRTVFEVTSGKLGAQNSVGGGGRYDGLLKQLGGPDLPSIGFGVGLERVIQLLLQEGIAEHIQPPQLTLMILPLDDNAKTKAFLLVEELRKRSVRSVVDFTGRKLKQAVAASVDAGAEWLLVLGERELETGKGSLKYLADGTLTEVSLDQIDVLVHLLHSRHTKG